VSTGNVILDVAEEYGAKREKEEIVRKMLLKGIDSLDILDITGLDIERLRELRDLVRSEVV